MSYSTPILITVTECIDKSTKLVQGTCLCHGGVPNVLFALISCIYGCFQALAPRSRSLEAIRELSVSLGPAWTDVAKGGHLAGQISSMTPAPRGWPDQLTSLETRSRAIWPDYFQPGGPAGPFFGRTGIAASPPIVRGPTATG